MRVLGIETSTRRGSVALLDGEDLVLFGSHERLNAHAEAILPLIERLMAEAGWARTSLSRVAVGVGPGSFTGLRVGIALAHGIGLGLGIPVVGVGSLQTMAQAVPGSEPGQRCPILDARRGEVFAALYDRDGTELSPPRAVARAGIAEELERLCPLRERVLVGEACRELDLPDAAFRSAETDLPHAIWTARIGARLSEETASDPLYVRDAGAVRPELPPSPFEKPPSL